MTQYIRTIYENSYYTFDMSFQDTTLRGFNIPASAHVMANLYAVHMDPTIFPNPKQFNPDRHLDEHGCLVKTDSVIPFGVGRHCSLLFISY